MSADPEHAPSASYVAEAARLMGLALDEASLAAVVANARILRAMAAEFADLPLADDFDPAEVLRL